MARFDEMKQAFESQQQSNSAVQNRNADQEESKQVEQSAATSLTPALIESMNSLSDQLIEQRKQLKPPANYPQRENVGGFREAQNGALAVCADGGTVDTLDVSTAPSGAILVTTSTNQIKILDSNGALSETIPIDKRVTMARFAPKSDTIAIFAFEKTDSEGAVAQVWNLKNKKKVYDISVHTDKITDVCFTPLERFVAICSADGSWSLHDYMMGKQHLLLREQAKISALQFHPDGLIMAIGLVNGKILVYDVRDMVLAQELDGPATAAVKQLEFSNKGIFLAASWEGQDACRVYSLHKGFAFAEIKQPNVPITTLTFDLYGGFLAVGTA